MKIKVEDKTYIESDGMQYIVKRYTGNITTDKKGDEREGYQVLGYYGTIESLIKGLYNKKMYESKATTLKQLLEESKKVSREIKQLVNGK